MNDYLSIKALEKIPFPEILHCDYYDLDDDGKKAWHEFAFNAIFLSANLETEGLLGRELKLVELNLISRRIVNFLKRIGIDYNKDNV